MKGIVSELTGTFFLVFCGTGAIVINQESGGPLHMQALPSPLV